MLKSLGCASPVSALALVVSRQAVPALRGWATPWTYPYTQLRGGAETRLLGPGIRLEAKARSPRFHGLTDALAEGRSSRPRLSWAMAIDENSRTVIPSTPRR